MSGWIQATMQQNTIFSFCQAFDPLKNWRCLNQTKEWLIGHSFVLNDRCKFKSNLMSSIITNCTAKLRGSMNRKMIDLLDTDDKTYCVKIWRNNQGGFAKWGLIISEEALFFYTHVFSLHLFPLRTSLLNRYENT